MVIFLMTLTLTLTLLLMPLYIIILKKIGFVQNNYQSFIIPIGMGLFLFFIESVMLILYQDDFLSYYWVYILLIVIIGTYDDIYGEKSIKGLRGHIKNFFQGKITSGFLKAFFGGLVAIIIGLKLGVSVFEYLINAFIIALMMNCVNLFDLKPGRALKLFFILIMLLGVSTSFFLESLAGLVLLSTLLIVFFYDLKGKIMLGDSGANFLGLHLGIWYATYFPIHIKVFVVFFLILIHLYAELCSFSSLIDNNKILKSIDRWGVKSPKIR